MANLTQAEIIATLVDLGVKSVLETPIVGPEYYEDYGVRDHHDTENAVDEFADVIAQCDDPEMAREDALDAVGFAYDSGREAYAAAKFLNQDVESTVRSEIALKLEGFKFD